MPLGPPPTGDPDLQEHIALLPKTASARGVLFTDLLERVRAARPYLDLAELAGIEPRRYVPFFQYPYEDLMRLSVASCKAVHPKRSLGDALRRMGRAVYSEFVATHAGRVMFGILGNDTESILMKGPKAYRLSLNFGDVTAKLVEPSCVRLEYRRLAGFLATYQVGVVEGAVLATNAEPSVLVEVHDLANMDMVVRWAPRSTPFEASDSKRSSP